MSAPQINWHQNKLTTALKWRTFSAECCTNDAYSKPQIIYQYIFDVNILLPLYQTSHNVPETTQEQTEPVAENIMTVAKDPRYARYLKMVQVVSLQYHK